MAKPSEKAFMSEQHGKAHEFHKAAAKEHHALAERHAGASKDHAALAEAFSGDPAEQLHKSLSAHHAEFSKGHAKLMKLHADHAEDHAQAMETCGKLDAGGDLTKSFDNNPQVQAFIRKTVSEVIGNTLQPTSVSVVTPNRPGLTAVPRNGQPAPQVKPNVPLEFQKLVSIEDGSEEAHG